MNHYMYDEIPIGHTETFAAEITADMVEGFSRMTGDSNPLHTDAAFAGAAGFDGKPVYGMLTAALMSTLAGVYLPGENSLIHKAEAEFPAPVYVGDTLALTGVVVRKDDNFKTIELKVTAKNGEGKKVLRGRMRVGVLK